ncbi:hypothetical protein CCHR01_16534 [Colletotrichum chrysophilum]|uniref:Ornithine aminotransferase n=1 Tax=Colletotrichum chrysophilum TaxID=1836956 RepID=A0AAD9E9X3_9PEZI|nr:hypothetical protein CCHR01_16534 [Colletotrichum chrysophilum]
MPPKAFGSAITLANIAGQAEGWPHLAKRLCDKFGYQKVLVMTSGSEATDTACKLARGWGVDIKQIDPEKVLVLGTSDNYHGTLSGVWPLMEPEAGWGGKVLRYLHVEDYAEIFEQMHERIAAVIMEPLHGLARSMEEEIEFCIGVRKLCKQYNILFIADEVHEVMDKMKPYQSVSTFSMSSMAVTAVTTALQIYEEENLEQRARDIHAKWVSKTSIWKFPWLRYCPAFGADLNILLDTEYETRPEKITPRRFSLLCASKGLLVFPGPHGRIRLGVALTIPDADLFQGFQVLREALEELPHYEYIEGSEETKGAF